MRYDLLHPKALHKALVEHLGEDAGVPGERQVRRWVTGDTPFPAWARRAVDEIMAMPQTAKEPPPEWAEALMTRDEVLALVGEVQSAVTTEITTTRETVVAALAREVTRRALEGNETLLTRIHDVLARVENRLAE